MRVIGLLAAVLISACQCGPVDCPDCGALPDAAVARDAGSVPVCQPDGGVVDAGAPFRASLFLTNATFTCTSASEIGATVRASFSRVVRPAPPCPAPETFVENTPNTRCVATLTSTPVAPEVLLDVPVDVTEVRFAFEQSTVTLVPDGGVFPVVQSALPLWRRMEALQFNVVSDTIGLGTATWTPSPVLITEPDLTGGQPLEVTRSDGLRVRWSEGGGVVYLKIWNDDGLQPAAQVECEWPIGLRAATVPASLLAKLRPGRARLSIETGEDIWSRVDEWEVWHSQRTTAGVGEGCLLGTPALVLR